MFHLFYHAGHSGKRSDPSIGNGENNALYTAEKVSKKN